MKQEQLQQHGKYVFRLPNGTFVEWDTIFNAYDVYQVSSDEVFLMIPKAKNESFPIFIFQQQDGTVTIQSVSESERNHRTIFVDVTTNKKYNGIQIKEVPELPYEQRNQFHNYISSKFDFLKRFLN